MDGLRLILLLAGAVVIVAVYLYSRRDSGRGSDDGMLRQREPRFDASEHDDELPDDFPPLRATKVTDSAAGYDAADDDVENHEALTREPGKAASPATPREKIIVLNILPVEPDDRFPGADLLDVFDRAGLEYGQYDVFHRIKESPDGAISVFSVVSATEPGSFDITRMAEESFRGLSLFMLLPGPVRGVDAFADMLATARRIAEQIRGEVTDRERSSLTRQTARHIREEIIAFENGLPHES